MEINNCEQYVLAELESAMAENDRLRVERAKPPDERAPVEPARPLGTAEASDRLAKRIGSDYEVVGNKLVRKRAKSDAKRQIE